MSGFNVNLDAITENASRLGMRIQETFSEHTRDLVARGSSALYLDAPEDKLREVKKRLDTGSDRDKIEALKRLIALISKGRNVSEYFAQVVKNVASPNLEVRKLVYIYLLRYAEQEPDLALLSINTFQKDLNDPNPLIRAMALRVLSGIKVSMIGSIVVLAIRKCAADPSPYVRKAAAYAIPKCYSLDPSNLPELIGVITSLLKDQSPLSIGNTMVAFDMVCPTRLDLLHIHYRRLCHTLVDVDEWGQVNMLNLLLRYVRTMLAKPSDTGAGIDPDIQLLLASAEPLFMSRNPAVVLGVASVFYYIAPLPSLPKIVAPLLRIMRTSREVERVMLSYLLLISQAHPALFSAHYPRLFVRHDDPTPVKIMKVQLLLQFADHDNHQAILREILNYAEDADDQLVQEAFKGIGSISLSIPASSQQCLNSLMAFIQSKHDIVVGNAVLVLKSLVQHQASASDSSRLHLSIIAKLAQRIEQFHHPQAKACVIWLAGQYAPEESPAASPIGGIASWAPDVLRRTTKTFITEPVIVKLQVLTLAAKLITLAPTNQTLVLITRFVLSMSRYDADYDVRDRARALLGLLRGVAPGVQEDGMDTELSGVVLRREQVRLVLFTGKIAAKPEDTRKATLTDEGHALLGSLGVVTGREMRGDRILPDWLEQGTEASLRTTTEDAPRKVVPTAFGSSAPRGIASNSAHASPVVLTPMAGSPLPASARGAFTDLDKFYEESESDESEASEEGSEEGSGESEAETSSAPETETDDEDDATPEAGTLLHRA